MQTLFTIGETKAMVVAAVAALASLAVCWTWRSIRDKWRRLGAFGKVAAIAVFCALVWRGGAKNEGGDRGVDSPAENSEAQRETSPSRDANAGTNPTLSVTSIEAVHSNCSVVIGMEWNPYVFNGADSRFIQGVVTTNLVETPWRWLGEYLAPQNTNGCEIAVSSNTVDFGARDFFSAGLPAAGFFAFGLDIDTDGDGLNDISEQYVTLTDPFLLDTDGDGIPDGAEIASGTNPLAVDSDDDGLDDSQESGAMFALENDDFLWFDVSGGTDLLSGLTMADGGSWRIPLPFPISIDWLCYTNAQVCMDGTVHLLCPYDVDGWYDTLNTWGGLSNVFWSSSHVTVSLCGADLFARTQEWESRVLHGMVTSGGRLFSVIEYRNIGLWSANTSNELIDCQLILPADETNIVYVSYLCASNSFRASSIVAGVQCGWKPPQRPGDVCYNLSWPHVAGFPQDGLTIKYRIGTGTDPNVPDTDGDGLLDGEEVLEYRTDPLNPDTDGDGMGDEWEIAYGLDPLSGDGDDGADGDSDHDGLPNSVERAVGTSPSEPDTDGDGLFDGEETGLIVATNSVPWLPLPANATDIILLFSDPDESLVNYSLQNPVVINGETATNAVIDLNGVIYLPRKGANEQFHPLSWWNLAYELCTNAFVLAPYLDDLYLTNAEPAPRISVAETVIGTNPVFVVQYDNVCPYYNRTREYSTNAISFQVIVPMNGTGPVYYLYRDIIGDDMSGSDANIGIQLLGGRWAHTYSYYSRTSSVVGDGDPMTAFASRGSLSDGLALSFVLGFATDPLEPDTDGDGLDDGMERDMGTSPINGDTDGDGMGDGWEASYEGFDPLVDSGTDSDPDNDAEADVDQDGLSNMEESVLWTDPWMPDTDADGVSDGDEAAQGTDPRDHADVIPSQWVVLTGDLDEGIAKTTNATVNLPAGTIAYVGVFAHSAEYPYYTGEASEYNDLLSWTVQADGNETISGELRVNNEDGAWDSAAQNGQYMRGFEPVVRKGSKIYRAGSETNLAVSVSLSATNVRDGAYPSTLIVGFFPIRVVQGNMPHGVGVSGTSDGGLSYTRECVPSNGVAYITAQPAPPQLTVRFKDLPGWIPVGWSGSLTTERIERFTLDNRTLAARTAPGNEAYDMTGALNGEIVGGRCEVCASLDCGEVSYPFSIRGKNPSDCTASEYITANVDAEFQPYAWMIAKHESKSGGRVYNQFNPDGAFKELPNKTSGDDSWGWGIAQIDKGRQGDATAEVYDWHANVVSMNEKLRSSLSTYNRFVGYYRDMYANNPNAGWFEPDSVTTMVDGFEVSAEMWCVLTFYNGAGGCPVRILDGVARRTPIEFDPATTNWLLYVNSQNYVHVTVSDRNQPETE